MIIIVYLVQTQLGFLHMILIERRSERMEDQLLVSTSAGERQFCWTCLDHSWDEELSTETKQY